MDIDILKKLAGLLNSTPVVKPEPTVDQSCGCGQPESSGENMRKFIDVSTFEEEELDEDEWANSSEQFDGEPRTMEQPHGEVVDTSLRRYLKAKGQPVKVEETDNSMESELEEAFIEEGIKDKLKVLALLGLTGLGANYALNASSAANSPLGKAMQQAAQSGDEYAAEHLKNLNGYVETNSPMLRTLNQMYIQEQHTPEKMFESYKKFIKENMIYSYNTATNHGKHDFKLVQYDGYYEVYYENTGELIYKGNGEADKFNFLTIPEVVEFRRNIDSYTNLQGNHARKYDPTSLRKVRESATDMEEAKENDSEVDDKEEVSEEIAFDLEKIKKNAGLV